MRLVNWKRRRRGRGDDSTYSLVPVFESCITRTHIFDVAVSGRFSTLNVDFELKSASISNSTFINVIFVYVSNQDLCCV
jgi:hypothetical protein